VAAAVKPGDGDAIAMIVVLIAVLALAAWLVWRAHSA